MSYKTAINDVVTLLENSRDQIKKERGNNTKDSYTNGQLDYIGNLIVVLLAMKELNKDV